MSVPEELAAAVRERAAGQCQYCLMHQSLQGATFHVEHVVPRTKGGKSLLTNLALACPACNLHKADRTTAIDPASGTSVPMFHPGRHILLSRLDTLHRVLTPSLSHPMGEGARRAGEGDDVVHPGDSSVWSEHFRFDGNWVQGLTAIGRATVEALDLNHERRRRIRAAEKQLGLCPPLVD